MSLSIEQLTASVWKFWQQALPVEVPTVYPGMRLRTDELSEWYEVWINTWSRGPQRISNSTQLEVLISVHVFVRLGSDAGRWQELADIVRQTFEQQCLDIWNFDESGEPRLGFLTLREATVRDLTREEQNRTGSGLRHGVVAISGTGTSDG